MPPVPRLHVAPPLAAGIVRELDAVATRHVQVLRLRTGDAVVLFDGSGGQWSGTVDDIGKRSAQVRVGVHEPIERELPQPVLLAVGMPANERMDALIEKATELGAAAVQPLVTARSVLRLEGERGDRRARHWQAVAQASCEQCGRNQVPTIAPPVPLMAWLEGHEGLALPQRRLVLSVDPDAPLLAAALADAGAGGAAAGSGNADGWAVLSGPEGGLAPDEEGAARALGLRPVSLGPRVLRADTAPLAALVLLGAAASAKR